MSDIDTKRIKELLESACLAPTKGAARTTLKQLRLIASGLKGSKDIEDYYVSKLHEAIGYAEEASGRVNNKDHWISCMNQSLYTFESGVGEV